MSSFLQDVSSISALADDLRRELYLFVSSQPGPVSREQAAQALGVPTHQAKFHLDRLEEAGLLEAAYVRLSGRSGPGAGRPAKTYHRRAGEISVSLPDREYVLAGELMATAIDEATENGTSVVEALALAAHARGADIARASNGKGTPVQIATDALRRFGYEPQADDDHVILGNCPFRTLAMDHPQLVCGMNTALLDGVCDQVGGLRAVLEPGSGGCCVVLRKTASS